MINICRRKWQRRGFASGPLGNKGPCNSDGCEGFTLTVEALAFVSTDAGDGDREYEIIASATNQEYLFKEDGEVVSRIIPWITFPEDEGREGILASLSITVDRSCCQDAIQISLVGENTQDLAEYVPLNFEIPEGESAIMIPLVFSSEASLGPKIIGVQAIGCGQNKIKDLYFEYNDPNVVTCPPFVDGFVSVYNNFGTGYDLYFYSQIGGDYEVEFFIDGISAGIVSGYTNGDGESLTVNVSAAWDDNATHQLNITFSPYELPDLICGDYSTTVSGVGSFSDNFTLIGPGPEEPNP